MSDALNRAFASNEATPVLTIEFIHASFTGGLIRLVRGYKDFTATLEDASTVTFSPSGIGIAYPEKSTDGRQDLNIQIDNVSNVIWTEVSKVIEANRTSEARVQCKFRSFLTSDLSQPQGEIYTFTVTTSSIDRVSALIQATYTPIPDTQYPRSRYYPTTYPGIKYV